MGGWFWQRSTCHFGALSSTRSLACAKATHGGAAMTSIRRPTCLRVKGTFRVWIRRAVGSMLIGFRFSSSRLFVSDLWATNENGVNQQADSDSSGDGPYPFWNTERRCHRAEDSDGQGCESEATVHQVPQSGTWESTGGVPMRLPEVWPLL